MTNAWGPLGNPTKEEIQKWCELPHGQFTALVKERCRKRRGKLKTEHLVYVTKRVYQDHACIEPIKVLAYTQMGAHEEARFMIYSSGPEKLDNIKYEDKPYNENFQYLFHSYNPHRETKLANAK